MKGAIASVELFVHSDGEHTDPRRLTLTLSAPERVRDKGEATPDWVCRIVLADLHQPVSVKAADSLSALACALGQGRRWLDALREEGLRITRDRNGKVDFFWSDFGPS